MRPARKRHYDQGMTANMLALYAGVVKQKQLRKHVTHRAAPPCHISVPIAVLQRGSLPSLRHRFVERILDMTAGMHLSVCLHSAVERLWTAPAVNTRRSSTSTWSSSEQQKRALSQVPAPRKLLHSILWQRAKSVHHTQQQERVPHKILQAKPCWREQPGKKPNNRQAALQLLEEATATPASAAQSV